MKANNYVQLTIPESITDPEEREYFELMYKALEIAREKTLPLLCLTAYSDMNKAFLATQGCKACVSKLILALLEQDPDMLNVIMGGIAVHLMNKSTQDRMITEYAKKNDSAGN